MRTRAVPGLTVLLLAAGVWACSGSDKDDGGAGGSSGGSSSGGKSTSSSAFHPEPCGIDDGTSCALDSGLTVGVCCSGSCVDTQTDSANCQDCGQVCPLDSTCSGGLCRCNGGPCVEDTNGVAVCDAGADSGAGCAPGLGCGDIYYCVQPTCGGGTPGGACLLPYDGEGICCDGGCFERAYGCVHPVHLPDGGEEEEHPDGGDAGPKAHCDAGPDGGCPEETDGGVDGGVDGGPDAGLDGGADAGFDAGFTLTCGKLDGEGCPLDGGGGVCCEGACVDPQTDIADCGGCGRNCPVGASCSDGSCVAGTAGCGDGGSCAPGLVCVGSRICLSTACGAGETGAECALLPQGTIGSCQDGVCTPPQQDAGVQTDAGPGETGDGGPGENGDGGHDAGPDAGHDAG